MAQTKRVHPLATIEDEQYAMRLFPYMTMSPEEYAARHGFRWLSFSHHQEAYRDKRLDIWIQRLGTILFTPGLMEEYQKILLTSEELAEVREQMRQLNASLF